MWDKPERNQRMASPKTILLVDDEAIIAAGEARLLRDEGYAVLVATSAKKAIETVNSGPDAVDLILMDIDLGKGMDGARAAQEILKEHDIPIVFLSSHTEKEIVEKTEKITSYGYVVKDSGITVLSASIRMAFKLHEAREELERHEEALRESRERFSNAFEYAAIGMALASPEGRWLKVNRQLCGILGYSEEEMLVMNFRDLTHPEDLEASVAPFDRVLAGDISAYELTKRYIHKGGSVIWVYATVSVIRDKAGLLLYVIAQIQDITERKRAEESLRRSEKRFRQIVENEGGFIWEVDTNGLYTYASPIIEKILGFRPDELVGKSYFYDHFAPDVREELKAAVMASFARKDSFRGLVNPNIRKDGVYVILETSGAPIISESGAFLGYRGIVKDITERKRTEEKLFIRGFAVESSINPIALADMEGNLTYANPAYVKLWGYDSEEEILGKPISEFTLSEKKLRKVVETIQSGREYVSEGISRKKDGTEIVIRVSSNIVTSPEGRPIGIMGSFNDVTERKRAEESLRNSIKQKEILMKELRHRVKNSLAVVSGLMALEMEGLADSRCREIFDKTRARIRAVSALYESLSPASDIDTIDLRAHVGRLAEDLFKTYARRDIRLTTRLDEIRLDTRRAMPLGLILNELVTNALKYAYVDGAGGEARVELVRTDGGITLSVADDGVGLPDGFNPSASGGTGMSLIRMLAEQIEGELAFERRNGTKISLLIRT